MQRVNLGQGGPGPAPALVSSAMATARNRLDHTQYSCNSGEIIATTCWSMAAWSNWSRAGQASLCSSWMSVSLMGCLRVQVAPVRGPGFPVPAWVARLGGLTTESVLGKVPVSLRVSTQSISWPISAREGSSPLGYPITRSCHISSESKFTASSIVSPANGGTSSPCSAACAAVKYSMSRPGRGLPRTLSLYSPPGILMTGNWSASYCALIRSCSQRCALVLRGMARLAVRPQAACPQLPGERRI
jgi:hypothetical protein